MDFFYLGISVGIAFIFMLVPLIYCVSISKKLDIADFDIRKLQLEIDDLERNILVIDTKLDERRFSQQPVIMQQKDSPPRRRRVRSEK